MIKSELILAMAKHKPNIPERDVEHCINNILGNMSSILKEGGRIEIRGFGSFSLHYRKPRSAHNPKTGKRLLTDAKYSPHFKPGKELKETVNNSRLHYVLKHDPNKARSEAAGDMD